jgi:hypothetical protein
MKKAIGDVGSLGGKVLSWFVVAEDDEARVGPRSEPVPAALAASASPRETPVPPPLVRPGGAHDAKAFGEVYARAGIEAAARERLARVSDLLAQLPAAATLDVKRAIVSASLQAFGVPVPQILTTCEAAASALDAHATEGRARTGQVLAEAQARIDRLGAEISEIRRLMEVQHAAQEELVRACEAERSRVTATRDFFDVPRERLQR